MVVDFEYLGGSGNIGDNFKFQHKCLKCKRLFSDKHRVRLFCPKCDKES